MIRAHSSHDDQEEVKVPQSSLAKKADKIGSETPGWVNISSQIDMKAYNQALVELCKAFPNIDNEVIVLSKDLFKLVNLPLHSNSNGAIRR